MYQDTIAAISTATGDSGIGIVRISGSDALESLRRVFACPPRARLAPGGRKRTASTTATR